MLAIVKLQGGLSAFARPALPALARQIRCYGFGSHMSDNDPELMEREKQRSLKGKIVSHMRPVPGWNERLASDSEAAVKAEHDCPDCPIDVMQQQTLDVLKEEEEADLLASGGAEPQSGTIHGN